MDREKAKSADAKIASRAKTFKDFCKQIVTLVPISLSYQLKTLRKSKKEFKATAQLLLLWLTLHWSR